MLLLQHRNLGAAVGLHLLNDALRDRARHLVGLGAVSLEQAALRLELRRARRRHLILEGRRRRRLRG